MCLTWNSSLAACAVTRTYEVLDTNHYPHHHHHCHHWVRLSAGPCVITAGTFKERVPQTCRAWGRGGQNSIWEKCTNKSPKKYCGSLSNDNICLNFTRKPKRKWNWQLLKMITDAPDHLLLVEGAQENSRCMQALLWRKSVHKHPEKWHRSFCSLARKKHHIWRRSPGWHGVRRLSCLLDPHCRTSINSGHHQALWKMLKTGQYDPALRRLITGEWLN